MTAIITVLTAITTYKKDFRLHSQGEICIAEIGRIAGI